MNPRRYRFLLTILVWGITASQAWAQLPDPFLTARTAHGGASAIQSAFTVVISGTSTIDQQAPQPVTISADLNGKLRLDYGEPVRRSLVYTPQGAAEMLQGRRERKSPHVGAFAQLDVLGIFGIRHLIGAGVQQTTLPSVTVAGRVTNRVKALTNRQMTVYNRSIVDEVEVGFDQQTGLVSQIARRQFADRSLDVSFILTTRFSDYRPLPGIQLPYRIDRYLDGVLRETILVQTIQINSHLASNLFDR